MEPLIVETTPVPKSNILKYSILVIIVLIVAIAIKFYSNKEKSAQSAAPVEKVGYWKEYKDPVWGFTLKYPNKFYVAGGPRKMANDIGEQGNILQISDSISTTTAKRYIAFTAAYVSQFKTPEEAQKTMLQLASSSERAYAKVGTKVTSEKKNINGQVVSSVVLSDSRTSKRISYFSKPPILFMITSSPATDGDLHNILQSLTFTPATESVIQTYDFYTRLAYRADGDKAWCLRLFRRDPLDGCGTKTIAPGSFPIDFTKIEHTSGGEGGSVEGTTLSIDGKKGSHAWLAGAIANKSDMNYIEFDAEFVNGEAAESLLTVYLNDTEIGMVDARIDDGKSHQQFQLYIKHLIGLDPYQPTYVAPGLYSLSFRLDSFQDGKTSVKLSNIKAGLK